MDEFDIVMGRLKKAIRTIEAIGYDPYDIDIAKALGMSGSTYNTAKKEGRIPLKQVCGYCLKRNIDINYILSGQPPESTNENTNGIFYELRLVDRVGVSGGPGIENYEEEVKTIPIDEKSARLLGVDKLANYEAVMVRGDSMEPLYPDGSLIVVDRTKKDVVDGAVYIVNIDGETFVKRISFCEDGLLLVSDNKRYESIPVQPWQNVAVVGRVVGRLEAKAIASSQL